MSCHRGHGGDHVKLLLGAIVLLHKVGVLNPGAEAPGIGLVRVVQGTPRLGHAEARGSQGVDTGRGRCGRRHKRGPGGGAAADGAEVGRRVGGGRVDQVAVRPGTVIVLFVRGVARREAPLGAGSMGRDPLQAGGRGVVGTSRPCISAGKILRVCVVRLAPTARAQKRVLPSAEKAGAEKARAGAGWRKKRRWC